MPDTDVRGDLIDVLRKIARGSLVWAACLGLTTVVAAASAGPRDDAPLVLAQPSPQPIAPAPTPVVPPLGAGAYAVEWGEHTIPSEMRAGQSYEFALAFTNVGDETWPARGIDPADTGLLGAVKLSSHWLPAGDGPPVVWDGRRNILPADVAPGETVALEGVVVDAPAEPGIYRLQVTFVQEMVTWFESRGAATLIVPVTVVGTMSPPEPTPETPPAPTDTPPNETGGKDDE